MKPIFILVFLYANLLPGQVWIKLADYPAIKRDDGVAVVVNDKAYFGTGLIEWNATIDFFALDLNNHTWTNLPTMPHTTERQYACAFAGPNCFYIFGGDGVGGALNNMYKYDIAVNTWTPVASKPGNGLVGASCMSFGDKVIISGGKFQSGKVSDEVWEYTISSDSWLQKNNYPFPGRWRASATVYNHFGYLIFGRDTAGAFRKEFYKYDPSGDSWTKIMDFPAAKGRAYAALQVANTKLTVFGGTDTLNTLYKDIWYFNETTSSWLQGPDLPSSGRKGGMSCALGENFYYSCGIGESGRLTETWKTDVPVGIKENPGSQDLAVYPNPTGGMLHIAALFGNYNSLSCSYSDIYGKEYGNLNALNSGTSFDLSELQAGIYILKFYSGTELVHVKRVIKN